MFLLYIYDCGDIYLVCLFSTKEKLDAYIDKHPLTKTTQKEYYVKKMEVDPA